MLKFLSLFFLFISGIILYFSAPTISREIGTNSNPTKNRLLATYVIDIITGSGVSYKFQHFYPLNIAIPMGTTGAWFNNDLDQIHIVTSNTAGDPKFWKTI